MAKTLMAKTWMTRTWMRCSSSSSKNSRSPRADCQPGRMAILATDRYHKAGNIRSLRIHDHHMPGPGKQGGLAGSSARKSSRSSFTAPRRRHARRRTASSRTIRNPALGRSRTCRIRRSYHPVYLSAAIAHRFFECRSRRTIRTLGSPNTPYPVALAPKPANEYPPDRCQLSLPRFDDH
jgi:hypothetical protein